MIDGKLISIERVIEGLYRDSAFAHHLDWIDAVEWSFELIRELGVLDLYERKTECLTIENNSAELPCDFHDLQDVREFNSGVSMPETTTISYTPDCDGNVGSMAGYGYKINGDRIYTSFAEGNIYLDYDAIMTAENGMPMIKDDEKVLRALRSNIEYKLARKLYHIGKLPQHVYKDIAQEAACAKAAAQSKGAVPSPGKMRSLFNLWVSLSGNYSAPKTGMATANRQERLKNFNTVSRYGTKNRI
jgi:hypothetical protein